ncbi:hypothetical protein [Micromonospora okii]|nr:hypothetical protein [Micromonospora okii]
MSYRGERHRHPHGRQQAHQARPVDAESTGTVERLLPSTDEGALRCRR